MKYTLTLIFFFSFTFVMNAQTTLSGTIQHDGNTRQYILDVPTSYDGNQPVALVFNLHGVGSNSGQQRFYSEMWITAEANGFLVCHPDGIDNAWNVGFDAPMAGDVDDVGFISALIDTLSTEYNIDPHQVYSCGMSLGGFMSYRLACELEGRIAAVASITGSMGNWLAGNCNPDRPVPVLQMHGTADDVVLIDGSPGAYPSIDNVINLWRTINTCGDQAESTMIPDTDMTDGSTVEKFLYNDCADDTEVEYWLVTGGEHTWPGAFFDIGVTNQDVEASDEIWNFFQRHPHPGVTTSLEVATQLDVSVYPNPAQRTLFIEGAPVGPLDVRIWNTLGQLVFNQTVDHVGGDLRIDLDQILTNGVHYLKLDHESGHANYTFVKQ
ncbi:MAG: T9SS type A sorting domain-containing protein [Bacteroidota bacterium]